MATQKIETGLLADDSITADKLANSINTDIATGVTGNTTANAALPKAGGTMTGQLNTGHVKLTGTGTDNDSHTLYFTNGAAAIARDNNDLELHAYNAMIFGVSNTSYPTSTERMRIDSSGNVCVGTVHDGAHGLTIDQDMNLSFGTGNDNESYVNFFRQASSAAAVMATGYKYTGTANKMQSSHGSSWAKSAITANYGTVRFYTDAAAANAIGTDLVPTERMRISSAGKVGINDTDPSQMLSVSGTSSTPPARFTAVGNTNTLEVWGNSTASTSTGILCNAGTNSNDYSAKFRNYAGSTIMEVRGDSLVDTFGGIRLQDSNILALGQSSDTRLYYDGTDSLYITAVNGTANKIKTNANETYIMQANGNQLITAIANSEVIINNDSSGSVDFRVESDAQNQMFFVNAGTNMVTIGGGTGRTTSNLEVQAVDDRHNMAQSSFGAISGSGASSKYVEGVVAVNTTSSGAQLTIPHTSQVNLWRQFTVELTFVSGEYNLAAGRGGTCGMTYGCLNSLNSYQELYKTGNVSSTAVSGMNLVINFTNAYTSGLNNYEGVHVHYKVMAFTPEYFQVWNAALN